jgi:hypothetical protein
VVLHVVVKYKGRVPFILISTISGFLLLHLHEYNLYHSHVK